MSAMKACKKCGVEKILEEFSKHARCRDGRQGTCIACTALNTAAWLSTNRERKALTDALWEARNRDRKAKRRAKMKTKQPLELAAKDRAHNLRRRYGINLEEYQKLFDMQQGRCKVCTRLYTDFSRGLVVDHCHKTGQIRGLLCDPCNRALGLLQESILSLSNAITYLNQSTDQIP